MILLSGGVPLHWVLAWIEYGAYKVGIFDSIPELGSSSWTEPLLLATVDIICEHLGAPKITWDSGQWKCSLSSPVELERQLDLWSCGLFVVMAVKAVADQKDWSAVGDSHKNEMRKIMFDAMSSIPVSLSKFTTVQMRGGDDDDMPVKIVAQSWVDNFVETSPSMSELKSKAGKDNNVSLSCVVDELMSEVGDGSLMYHGPDVSAELMFLEDVTFSDLTPARGPSRKRERDEDSSDCDGEPHSKKPNAPVAQQVPQGTIKKGLHLKKKKPTVAPAGVSAISMFFTKQNPPKDTRVAKDVTVSQVQIQIWINGHRNIRLQLPQYSVHALHRPPAPKSQPLPPICLACKNLRGQEYQEYILRTQTRSLGSVSLEFRAWAMHQLMPWKPHRELKQVRNTKDTKTVFSAKHIGSDIPDGCNSHLEYRKWTQKEKNLVNEVLRAWAQWEVDYTDGCVRSTWCHGTTVNQDLICDACIAVAKDDSFQWTVRKVGVHFLSENQIDDIE
ncbi:hypothetical protein B0H10DRAFT_1938373 [Mycena sp. CBHHK59/15]|nr:hypothetical protein B0H10DRAFT_1938373 [Mycena sp. CBHHK59/15]